MSRTSPPPERQAFCDYLRKSREAKALSLEEIARITRIPERSLRRLEDGAFEALPADVFVRGFLRSYASCVGLDPDDAVRRYAACGLAPSPVSQHGAGDRRAVGTPAPELARGSVREPSVLSADESTASAEASEAPAAASRPAEPEPAPTESAPVDTRESAPSPAADEAAASTDTRAGAKQEATSSPGPARADGGSKRSRRSKRRRKRRGRKKGRASDDRRVEATPEPVEATAVEATPEPTRSSRLVTPPSRPALVIDDEDPDAAERLQEARADAESAEREASRRSFLPPSLLDSDEGSRRGALTLAVIILVIVATLTMSYLLRHPSSSGSGVTDVPGLVDDPATTLQA